MDLSALQQAMKGFVNGEVQGGKNFIQNVIRGVQVGGQNLVGNAQFLADKARSAFPHMPEGGGVPQPGNSPAPARKPTQEEIMYQNRAKALLKNTLDQTAYTPEARAYITKMALHFFGTEPVSSVENDMVGGFYQPGNGVSTNVRFMLQPDNGGYPVQAMRHELLHSMDKNVNAEGPIGSDLVDSSGFFTLLKQLAPRTAQNIYKNELTNGDSGNSIYKDEQGSVPYNVRDQESLAYFGQQGQSVLNNYSPKQAPIADTYNKVYAPYTPVLNYTPMFRAWENMPQQDE